MSSVPWYSFNWLDYTIVGIVVLSTIVSFFRGFIREAISLCIWAIGIVLALKLAPQLEERIHAVTHWDTLSYVLAFGVVFFSVWLIGPVS